MFSRWNIRVSLQILHFPEFDVFVMFDKGFLQWWKPIPQVSEAQICCLDLWGAETLSRTCWWDICYMWSDLLFETSWWIWVCLTMWNTQLAIDKFWWISWRTVRFSSNQLCNKPGSQWQGLKNPLADLYVLFGFLASYTPSSELFLIHAAGWYTILTITFTRHSHMFVSK